MSHSRPCHPVLLTVPQTKASSLSAGTELGAAATVVSSLYWHGPTFSTALIYWGIQTLFSPPTLFAQQTLSPIPSVPSPCPLLGLQFLCCVCLTLPWQQSRREAASTLYFSLIPFFFFSAHSFSLAPLSCYSSRVNSSMAALAVSYLYLSQLHTPCFFLCVCSYRWMCCTYARLPGKQMVSRMKSTQGKVIKSNVFEGDCGKHLTP